jgi:hypothetical protein
VVGDGNFGRCHTRQRTYGKVLVAILGRLRRDAVLQIYRGAIADDIASSFTEQMEAIERQIGINDDNRMKEMVVVVGTTTRAVLLLLLLFIL